MSQITNSHDDFINLLNDRGYDLILISNRGCICFIYYRIPIDAQRDTIDIICVAHNENRQVKITGCSNGNWIRSICETLDIEVVLKLMDEYCCPGIPTKGVHE